MAIDGSGNVYVADTGNNRIQKFTSAGAFLTAWGSAGTTNGQFSIPSGIAVDASGNVYVADTGNNRIQKFTSAGVFVAKWGTGGTGDGQFDMPMGIAVDATGLYVNDMGNHRVQKFSFAGAYFSKWGTEGIANGQFYYPTGLGAGGSAVYVADSGNNRVQKFTTQGVFVESQGNVGSGSGYFRQPVAGAVSSTGDVYVADTMNCRIQKFASAGTFVSSFGGIGEDNGKFIGPQGVATDSADNVYVADSVNNRVQKFTSAGKFVAAWGKGGTNQGELDFPVGIAIDSSDNVYVVDSGNNRVQKFTKSGVFVTAWGSKGEGNGQFNNPSGIGADKNGNIYVSDTANNRVQKFSTGGVFVKAWGENGTAQGKLGSPSGIGVDASGNVFVVDTDNHRVQKFTSDGTFLSQFGTEGTGTGFPFGQANFERPRGIAFSSSGESLYIVDTGNNRVQKFLLAGIQISSPNGGEHWARGTTKKIAWTYVGTTGFLYINLLKDDIFAGYITPPTKPVAVTSGSGSYAWTIPVTQTAAADYKVVLQSVAVPSGSSVSLSAANFSITATQASWKVTPSAVPADLSGGTITPATVQTVPDGGSASFTLAAKAGFQISAVGGTCGGTLNGTTYTTNGVTADCTVIATFGRKPPTITAIAPVWGVTGSVVTVAGTNFGTTRGTSTVSFNGTAVTTYALWSNTVIRCTVPQGATTGPVTVTTTSGTSPGRTFTVKAPVITAIAPPMGTVGTAVIIRGNYFGITKGTSTVSFNGTAVTTYALWSNTVIRCTVPQGATTGPVTVTTGSGTSPGKTFTMKAPAIIAIAPPFGTVGTSVVIAGSYFGATRGTSTVSFNGVPATSYTAWSNAMIRCIVPVGAATGPVTVTTTVGTSGGKPFTVKPPVITAIAPAAGKVGAIVTVAGNFFGPAQGASTVSFNGTAATVYTSWTNTIIKCKVPAGATSGLVKVTTTAGTSSGKLFTVKP